MSPEDMQACRALIPGSVARTGVARLFEEWGEPDGVMRLEPARLWLILERAARMACEGVGLLENRTVKPGVIPTLIAAAGMSACLEGAGYPNRLPLTRDKLRELLEETARTAISVLAKVEGR